jgi:hypothetical protein
VDRSAGRRESERTLVEGGRAGESVGGELDGFGSAVVVAVVGVQAEKDPRRRAMVEGSRVRRMLAGQGVPESEGGLGEPSQTTVNS